jgi:uncharacterized membrane protein YoaK (UPF0700 family)
MSSALPDAYSVCVLQLSYSSAAAITLPPQSDDFQRALLLLGPVFVFVLLVVADGFSIGELWFIVANALQLLLVSRRMPRMLNRALASKPAVI